MTRYTVQYELPCENPQNNVAKSKTRGLVTFYVPVNHPQAHNMGFQQLLDNAERSGLIRLTNKP